MAEARLASITASLSERAERILGEPPAQWWVRVRFGSARRSTFYEDLHAFVQEGIPPFKAMAKMQQVMQQHRSQRVLTSVLASSVAAGRGGASLAQSLKQWIPAEEAALMRAGEQTGDFATALARLHELVMRKIEIRKVLMAELVPASAMLIALIIIMMILQSTLLEVATGMLSPQDLATTSIAAPYVALATFVQNWGWLVGLSLVVAAVAVTASLTRWRPSAARQWVDDHIAPWSLYRRQLSTFFLVSAAAMMRAGTPFKRTVLELQASAAPWARTHMQRMLIRLGTGAAPVQAMGTGILPWDIQARLEVYAELPNVADVMESSARSSINILLKRTKTTGTIIRTVVMLGFAGFILATLIAQNELTMALEAAAKRGAL